MAGTGTHAGDGMRATAGGRGVRFRATDVRVFKGRDSSGVRGIRLGAGDVVVSMSIIRHFVASSEERAAYLKTRRALAGAPDVGAEADEDEPVAHIPLSQGRHDQMAQAEDLILSLAPEGAGKIRSSHAYPPGAKGIGNGKDSLEERHHCHGGPHARGP